MSSLLDIQDLHTYFYTRQGVAKAVCGVSFNVNAGEILGVVGESGSGKSVTALSVLRLVPFPGKITSGKILLKEQNLLDLSKAGMRQIRGDRISMIFQEPMISLNPAFTIGDQLMEALRVHRKMDRREARDRAVDMLGQVDIPHPDLRLRDYPHQLSGGMRQRVMIAEALLLNPNVLLADEPTTALDVTVQAQVLDIMYRVTQEMGTAIVLITHNLGLVAESANRVVVMYAGSIVEEGTAADIFHDARHPYTQGLLKSIPIPGQSLGKQRKDLYEMNGMIPSLHQLPVGCSFHPRCPIVQEVCAQEEPPWNTLGSKHAARCWLYV